MSESSSSSTIFCEASARGLSVVTSMPCVGIAAAGRREHALAFTSTTQARQLPSGRSVRE
jgi:hypothetical protein